MKSFTYLNKAGERYLVFHRNPSDMTWEHPYSEKLSCLACLGESTAAPVAP